MRGKLSSGIPIFAAKPSTLALAVVVCLGVGRAVAIAAPPAATLDKEEETPSDSELMLKALTAEHGESPNAARIERASRQARVDALRRRPIVETTWKDPFAEDPDREIPVRTPAPRKQRGSEGAAMRRELARARAEAAAAEADAAQAKAKSARAEALEAQAQAIAARHEAAVARAQWMELEKGKRAARARSASSRNDVGRFSLAVSHSTTSSPRLAPKTRAPRTGPPKAPPAPEPAPPADDRPEPPASAPESYAPAAPPGSIIVVPITR
jgi:colicin import membrane protein